MATEGHVVKLSEIKLFGKWTYDGIEVKDPSLKKYICLKPYILPTQGEDTSTEGLERLKYPSWRGSSTS